MLLFYSYSLFDIIASTQTCVNVFIKNGEKMLQAKKERIDREWSQAKLARVAEMHPSSVSLIENGKMTPYPAQIKKLTAALDWQGNPEDLFREVV